MAKFRDYGGDAIHKGCHILPVLGSMRGVCVLCQRQQPVSKVAWSRRTRPTCLACGGLLEPSQASQKKNSNLRTAFKPAAVKCCCLCGADLRSGNDSGVCAACFPDWKRLCLYFFPRTLVEAKGTVTRTADRQVFNGTYRLKQCQPVTVSDLCFYSCADF